MDEQEKNVKKWMNKKRSILGSGCMERRWLGHRTTIALRKGRGETNKTKPKEWMKRIGIRMNEKRLNEKKEKEKDAGKLTQDKEG